MDSRKLPEGALSKLVLPGKAVEKPCVVRSQLTLGSDMITHVFPLPV